MSPQNLYKQLLICGAPVTLVTMDTIQPYNKLIAHSSYLLQRACVSLAFLKLTVVKTMSRQLQWN